MNSRLRVPPVSGHTRHDFVTGQSRKFSPGVRNLGVLPLEGRYTTTMLFGTMVAMSVRGP